MNCSESYLLLKENKERIKQVTGKENDDDAMVEILTFSAIADIIEKGADIIQISRIMKSWRS
jgi:hypothetical protein